MSETCTYSEMTSRFSGEWVLVGDLETDENLQVVTGNVLWHSKDRDEVYRKAREIAPRQSAILYFGEIPDGEAIVLCAAPSTPIPDSLSSTLALQDRKEALSHGCVGHGSDGFDDQLGHSHHAWL